jgi:hypothetical protein
MKKACCKECSQGKTCASKHNNEFDEMENNEHYRGFEEKNDYLSIKSLDDFKHRVLELQNKNLTGSRPIDVFSYKKSLMEALLFPEIAKGIKLPSQFQIPTFSFQQRNSFTISSNSAGNCFVQVNLGQYLDKSMFKTGAPGDQNGTSPVGNSNVFVCNDILLDTVQPIAPNLCKAKNVMLLSSTNNTTIPDNIVNSVRPGPMCVKIEYIGRLDIASGEVLMGINYTSVDQPANTSTYTNGLLPDVRYTTRAALEDCPFAKSVPITETLKGVYIPHDYNQLNLRSPTDTFNTSMPQRLFILVNSAPPGQTICRVTIVANWEAVPSPGLADLLSTSYNTFPSSLDPSEIYNYIIKENLVVDTVK